MLFWIAAAAMTLAACIAVMLPFLRHRAHMFADSAHDLEVYRDQLAEVERDKARGLINDGEADQARAEIARRIIRLEPELEPGRARGGRSLRVVATVAVLAVPIMSWGLYMTTGSPDYPAQPLAARLAKDPAQSSIQELVARAELHLTTNPEDAAGWAVLAPIYLRLQRFGDAATAYRNAIRIGGPSGPLETGLGEALMAQAGGVVTAEAVEAFERALAHDADDPKAHFFIAYGKAQEGRLEEAAAGWEALASLPGTDPRWAAAAQRAASDARQQMPGAVAVGPDREQVAAADAMSDGDRQAMIEGMVSGLAERLRDNPDDPEGWQRLIRSYSVLGREAAARDALTRGIDALGRETARADELAAFARGLGIVEKTP